MEYASNTFRLILGNTVVRGPLDIIKALVEARRDFAFSGHKNIFEITFKIGHWDFRCTEENFYLSSAVSSETGYFSY